MMKLSRKSLTIVAIAAIAGWIGLFSAVSYAQSNADFRPKPQAEGVGEVPEAASRAEEASEHESGEPPDMNWFDVHNATQIPYSIYLVNFVLLIALYVGIGRKPVAEGLKSRRESIAKEIEDAQKMKKEAKARAKKYQAKLEGLDEELASAKQGLIEAGEADKARIVREAEEKAARMNRDAAALLEQESRQVHDDLVNETVEAAVREAEELLKKRVMPEDHERLAEDFLASLGKRPPPNLATANDAAMSSAPGSLVPGGNS